MNKKSFIPALFAATAITSCGGSLYNYEADEPILAECLVGEKWKLEDERDVLNQEESSLTFYADGTFEGRGTITTYNKITAILNNYFLGREFPEELPSFLSRVYSGTWEVDGDFMTMVTTKMGYAEGDFKWSTEIAAISQHASAPDETDPYQSESQYHCDGKYLDDSTWKQISTSPAIYERKLRGDYQDGEHGSESIRRLQLNNDGSALLSYATEYTGHLSGTPGTSSDIHGVYSYETEGGLDVPPQLEFAPCVDNTPENCTASSSGIKRFDDRGSVLMPAGRRAPFYYRGGLVRIPK